MLRADPNTGDVYGFLGEGGYVYFSNINSITGEAVIIVNGEEKITKRVFVFGQQSIAFEFTADDVNKLGVGEHPYTLYTKDTGGIKNTLIPDPLNDMRPVFKIEGQE